MKVSIDTGSDNIGHRLFGEIVGTSDSNGVPVLCIEVAENNGDMAAPAQPVIPEQPHRISDDDLVAVPRSVLACAGYALRNSQLKDGNVYAELRTYRFAPSITAQPVSEAYKLNGWISVADRLPSEFGRYLCYVEEQNDLGKSHYQWNCSWNGDVFSDSSLTGRVTHWMPLPEAPAQEQK
ncbi:TPA: DUF551 domain-containing protein [Escherichia coli]|nr:DUF551 domain-containing protein [Escherichia coli]